MKSELTRLLDNSDKSEALEAIRKEIVEAGCKGIVIFITDDPDGEFNIHLRTFCVGPSYEAYGMLEAAKWVIQQDELDQAEEEL